MAKRDDHESRISELEHTMEKIILPWKAKTEEYLDKSRRGIDLVTLFDSNLTTVIVVAAVGVLVWFIRTGGGQ